jgi:imidazole glycerol-phosphate synthase subunit HisF
MLHPRIIPCLLIKNGGLVKTIKFSDPKYVGDPINAVKIFNEKEVDELIVLDIDATIENREPNYNMIKNLATECRMPLCYGGGVKAVDQVEKIISLGVEKVALSSAVWNNPEIVKQASQVVGNQSIVVVMDVKKSRFLGKYEIRTHNGKKKAEMHPVDFALQVQKLGAGEIVINSIDNDGVMKGYDHDIVEKIREVINIPMTVLGGAGSLVDIKSLLNKFGIIGASAGSLFVFKGKYRAVLINYPSKIEKEQLFQTC